jgi:DNA-binding CsgD family transcriptional regulator/tetratricopeptide (TPR) repeat protein
MDSPDDELLQLIDEAMEAHILEAATGGRERYRFRHALIQQTLNDSLSPSRKVRLHARLAQALESLYGDESTEHATELAYHFIAAEAVLGPSRGAHYSNVAGQQALASHAYEEALRHFQYALEARRDEDMDRDTADLYFGLAQAQAATLEKPHLVQTSDYLQRAFDYCIETGNVRRAIDIAVHQFGTIEGDNQRLARALELVSPDSHEAGRLLSRSLTILGYSREPLGDDISVYDRAIAIAQRYGDRVLEMQTLVNAGCADGSNLRLHAGIEKHLRAVELASVVDQPFAETHAQFELAFGFVSLGKLAEATYHAQAALASARRARNSWWLTMAFAIHQTLSCLQGDWEAARRYSHQGLEKSMNFATLLSGRAMLECETGNVEQSEWYLDLLLREGIPEAQSHRGMDPNIAVPMVARITGHDERIELAEAINTGILTWPAVTPWYRELAQVGLALTALQHHDHTMIQVCYDALRLVQGRMPHGCPYISGDRLSGLLANACGMTEMATTHFEDALLFCRQAGYWPELAWTCYDYARILNERLASADHDPATRTVRKKAMVLVEEALTMATALGMRPLYTHATTLKKQLLSTVAGRGRPPVALSPDGLTQREVQVLGLVAEGKTNPEIAARLRISPKTVTHHMTSILRKIGASNRTEAAAYAARNGLVTWS